MSDYAFDAYYAERPASPYDDTGEYIGACPKCGGDVVVEEYAPAYGRDTLICMRCGAEFEEVSGELKEEGGRRMRAIGKREGLLPKNYIQHLGFEMVDIILRDLVKVEVLSNEGREKVLGVLREKIEWEEEKGRTI